MRSERKPYQFIHRRNSADKILSCRYELKYRIRETKAHAIAQYIQSYISPDQYARKRPGHEYPVSSLYFDSDSLHLCKETLEGRKNRFKLRVRCYDDNPQSVCFFEIKRRINSVIFKNRARIPKVHLLDAIRGNMATAGLYKKDRETLDQFSFYLQSLRANPILSVRYIRQAYEGDSSNRVRITFDRELAFKAVDTPKVSVDGQNWHTVPMDFVILEIKFSDRYPYWLTDMVKIFDLKQTAMSKYVSSVKQSCSSGFYTPMCSIGQQ
ncbi:MAG: polyphosphate polymerase domain-containing protein [Planctomycetota bacterium]